MSFRKIGQTNRGTLPVQRHGLSQRPQESEAIRNLNYDPEKLELQIEFNKRGTYAYSNFPPDEFANFNLASSRGTYFNLYIRDAGYSYERIG